MNSPPEVLEFPGTTRLFPLPGFVMMPHVFKQFHIFEPRYRQMTEDALASDRLITLALPRVAVETPEAPRPELHKMACLTRIMAEHRLPDGRFLLVLKGICRVQLEFELLTSTLYRQAQAQLFPDPFQPDNPHLRSQLQRAARRWLPPQGLAVEQFATLLDGDMPLGALCDIIAFVLPLPVEAKQELLDTLEIKKRCLRLIEVLHEAPPPILEEAVEESPPGLRTPPDFSLN